MVSLNLSDAEASRLGLGASAPPTAATIKELSRLVDEGMLTPNEFRAFLGLSALAPGDDYRISRVPLGVELPESNFRPRIRWGHFLLFACAFVGYGLRVPLLFYASTILLVLILLYDIHQIRVLHEQIWTLLSGGKVEDDAP